MKISFISLLLTLPLCAEPLTDTWFTELTGRYARIYPDNEALDAQAPVTTWARGQGVQSQPTYAGVSEIAVTDPDVFIRTSGLGFHVMGPWYRETGDLFPNYPANQAAIYRFPRTPVIPASKSLTDLGTIGYFVDGISMFDSRDAFSYDSSEGVDEGPNTSSAVQGDDVWNCDAFVNESVTFDAANAHQAGSNHHYHANPPALRHLLGGSVTYDLSTNTYTEAPNGEHSPIIGWVRDGLPIYGPYAYSSPMDSESGIRRMISGYQKRDGSNGSTNLTGVGRTSRPQWQIRNEGLAQGVPPELQGPAVSNNFPLGHYLEDYAYKGDLSGTTLYDGNGAFNTASHFDLNEYNVRFCVTPDFPNGTWAYFTCIEPDGTPIFPYNISRYYFGEPSGGSSNNIPTAAITLFEGGPEKQLTAESVAYDDNSGDITFVWNSVEGGSYSISRSQDLAGDWDPLAEALGTGATTSVVDPDRRANPANLQLYRAGLNSISPFDDMGFEYDNSIIEANPQNNVLLLILDDWGIDSSELYNTETGNNIQIANMPTLRNLAENGILFTRGYSQPICSPTRATLLTGRQPFQHKVGNPQMDNTLSTTELTFPEIMSTEAPEYGLASFGKWHLGADAGSGNNAPYEIGGWPHFSGSFTGGVNDYFNWERIEIENGILTDNGTDVTTYVTTAQVDEAVSFINAQGSEPWVVWMGFNAPHTPFQAPPNSLVPADQTSFSGTGTQDRDLYVNSLEALDTEIGRLLASVDLSKTNIIVVGDNGTPGQVDQAPAGGIAGAKGSLTEGGIHVPFFVNGPDVAITGTSDKLVHVVDLFSTILDLTGVNTSTATQGTDLISQSIVPIFSGTDTAERCVISEVFNNNTNDGRAIIMDQWPDLKLISRQDVTDPDDTPDYEMYQLGANGVEAFELTVPPNPGDAHEAAYIALVAKDESLIEEPVATTGQTVYLELPNITGASEVPTNQNQQPLSVTIDGIEVTVIEDRFDQTDTFNQFWVKVIIPTTQVIDPTTATAVVSFSANPNTGDERVFTAIQIVVDP